MSTTADHSVPLTPSVPPSPLARYALAAYAVLVIYASVYPLSGWRDLGVSPLSFLRAPLPRYITAFDVVANLLAYFPLGFLVVAVLLPCVRSITTAVGLGIAASFTISLTMEALQTYLPARIPSNLDLATNTLGGLVGALSGATIMPRLLRAQRLRRFRDEWIHPGARVDLGLLIVLWWLLTQLNPETLLFGTGNLRDILAAVPAEPHSAALFVRIEAAVTAAQLVAVGLLIGALIRRKGAVWCVIPIIVATALAIRTLAFAILFSPEAMLFWATPGALLGLVAGTISLFLVAQLNRNLQVAIAGLLLMGATALVNVAPGNPYLAHSLAVWRQGHFLNFNGLTAVISGLWPFMALAYLLLGGGKANGERTAYDR